MKKARFKELTLTSSRIDEKLFKEKLRSLFVSGKSAREYMKPYWQTVKKAYSEGKVDKMTVNVLFGPLRDAVYDDFENKIYIPVPDKVFRDWFEVNCLTEMKKFLKKNFNVDDVELVVLEKEH